MMKELEDYKEEIYKCSRCGLCQSVCPVYKVTLNECSVSRAKFNMLNGVLNGDLSLNSQIKKYLNLCIGCNACKNFCPSNIDAREIFTAAKRRYYIENKPSFKEQVFGSYFLFKFLLSGARFLFSVYRLLNLSFWVKKMHLILPKRVLLLDALIHKNVFEKCSKQLPIRGRSSERGLRVIFFSGCFNKYLNNSSQNSVFNLFSQLDIELVEKDFECCGISYLFDGNIGEFIKLAKKNIEKAGENYDYILTDCASCNFVLKEYQKYVQSEQAEIFAQKVTSVLELLKSLRITSRKKLTVTAHKPCHEDFEFIELIKNIENINYVEAEDFDSCCGFSGKFAVQNSKISREISKRKAKKFLNTNADCIITTCPACVLGINQGLIENNASLPVYNLVEFIAKYCDISRV